MDSSSNKIFQDWLDSAPEQDAAMCRKLWGRGGGVPGGEVSYNLNLET